LEDSELLKLGEILRPPANVLGLRIAAVSLPDSSNFPSTFGHGAIIMTDDPSDPPGIQRSFRDLSDAQVADIANASLLVQVGLSESIGWDEVLQSQRILIVSEAGAGKTYECRARQERLWNAGEPAFFLDLATLATSSVRDMLNGEEEQRLDEWLRSQSEVATFFLDSIDELKLTLGKFDQALKRLNKSLAGQYGRVRVVITTRPVPVERALIEQHLPIPNALEAEPTAEAFADAVMDNKKKPENVPKTKAWRNVGLMPLSIPQMREFAVAQKVPDPDALLEDIRLRDAEEFAQRPQDLIELCSDWREHHRIRTHREWEHPKTGKKIDFDQLMVVLNEEAERLSRELGGEAKLMAKGLNLLPRLKTEKQARSKGK
jgi:hypothetical protein